MNRYLLLSLVILVVGCLDSPTGADEDIFESFRIGTWEVVSPDNAHWVGSPSASMKSKFAAKAATMFFEAPDNNELYLAGIETVEQSAGDADTWLSVWYAEPGSFWEDIPTVENLPRFEVNVSIKDPRFDAFGSAFSPDAGDGKWVIATTIPLSCDSDLNDESIEIVFFDDLSDTISVYDFAVNGLIETAGYIACE